MIKATDSRESELKTKMNTRFPLILAFLCVVAGRASAQVNLLPQGNFENPGANTEWADGFKVPNNQEFQVVSEQGKHWLRIENRDAGRQLDYVHAYVKVTPQIGSLTVSARMKATNLKIGKEGWHTARVAMSFEGGSFGFPAEVPELRADCDWVTKSVELTVPVGATRLNIQPAMFHCTGVFEIADLTVTPHVVARTQLGDAVLPADIALDWDKANVKTVNAKRAQVSLDGIWRFMPAAEAAAEPPKLGWAYIKVPGDWQIHPGKPSGFLALGGGPQWDLYDGALVTRAWYQRQAPIPAEWQGRAISLRFDRVCTDAIVYVNGTRMRASRLAVGLRGHHASGHARTNGGHPRAGGGHRRRGKGGDLLAECLERHGLLFAAAAQDAGPDRQRLLGKPFIRGAGDRCLRPHFNPAKERLPGRGAGRRQAGGPAQFVADMLNEKGEVEKSFTADAAVDAKETQTVALSWPWPDPRLWDVGQPNLYTLRLKVKGAGLDDQYDQKFGFREFWVGGHASSSSTAPRSTCGSLAFTTAHVCRWATTSRSSARRMWMPAATPPTRGGISTTPIARDTWRRSMFSNANKYMMSSGRQDGLGAEPAAGLRARRRVDAPLPQSSLGGHVDRRLQFLQQRGGRGPAPRGPRRLGSERRRWQRLMVVGKEMFDGLKKLDPTRVYYSHAGADTGDVYTMNCYLDLLPLQEREDWLSAWAAKRRDADLHGRVRHAHGLHVPARRTTGLTATSPASLC